MYSDLIRIMIRDDRADGAYRPRQSQSAKDVSLIHNMIHPKSPVIKYIRRALHPLSSIHKDLTRISVRDSGVDSAYRHKNNRRQQKTSADSYNGTDSASGNDKDQKSFEQSVLI